MDAVVAAAEDGVSDEIRAFVDSGSVKLADFDRGDTMLAFHDPPLWHALKARNWALCDWLVENGADPTNCLASAAYANNREGIERLRGYSRCDINRAKHVMFVCAVLEGHFELAEEMLLMGADIHHTPPGYVWADYALFEAAVTGKIEVVRWLLERGADPDVNLSKVLEVTRQRGLDDSYDLFANLVSV